MLCWQLCHLKKPLSNDNGHMSLADLLTGIVEHFHIIQKGSNRGSKYTHRSTGRCRAVQ
jgi:hypothetical protein